MVLARARTWAARPCYDLLGRLEPFKLHYPSSGFSRQEKLRMIRFIIIKKNAFAYARDTPRVKQWACVVRWNIVLHDQATDELPLRWVGAQLSFVRSSIYPCNRGCCCLRCRLAAYLGFPVEYGWWMQCASFIRQSECIEFHNRVVR